MRIQKYLSQKGILSRREAEKYIKAGLIKLNGGVVRDLGRQIDPEKDKIEILEAAKKEIDKKITVAVNKPRGIVCSKNESEGGILRPAHDKTIFELLPQFKDLNAVGRLDKESEGLIMLSSDGPVTKSVTGSDHVVEKEYEVEVRESIRAWHIRKLEEGVKLKDGKTLPAKARQLAKNKFSIILKEGRKHQIRRMASALHLTVENLRRVRIGSINLKGIGYGKHRILTKKEVAGLLDY